MKKSILFTAFAVSLFAVSAAPAQNADGTTTTRKRRTTTTATVSTRNNATLTSRLRRIEAESARGGFNTSAPTSRIDGSVSRAARSGNPLQMINPFAPKEYGDGTDVTRRESDDPYQRAQGLRLLAVEF